MQAKFFFNLFLSVSCSVWIIYFGLFFFFFFAWSPTQPTQRPPNRCGRPPKPPLISATLAIAESTICAAPVLADTGRPPHPDPPFRPSSCSSFFFLIPSVYELWHRNRGFNSTSSFTVVMYQWSVLWSRSNSPEIKGLASFYMRNTYDSNDFKSH